MQKQLELDLTLSSEADVNRYLREVELHSMRHFLGDNHPKVKELEAQIYSQ